LNRAVALDPREFESHWALGRALALKERYAEAAVSFQRAVALAPERSDAHYQLGLALRRLGRIEEANREFAIVDKGDIPRLRVRLQDRRLLNARDAGDPDALDVPAFRHDGKQDVLREHSGTDEAEVLPIHG
jgi:tetratricopeptide (TPR) repeat protein